MRAEARLGKPRRAPAVVAASRGSDTSRRRFTVTSLPVAVMFNEHTGVRRAASAWRRGPPPGAFQVPWHTNFTRFAGCDAVNGASSGTTPTVNGNQTPVALEHIFSPADVADSAIGRRLRSSPAVAATTCPTKSRYRNTNMRDIFGLQIPAGAHSHAGGEQLCCNPLRVRRRSTRLDVRSLARRDRATGTQSALRGGP